MWPRRHVCLRLSFLQAGALLQGREILPTGSVRGPCASRLLVVTEEALRSSRNWNLASAMRWPSSYLRTGSPDTPELFPFVRGDRGTYTKVDAVRQHQRRQALG